MHHTLLYFYLFCVHFDVFLFYMFVYCCYCFAYTALWSLWSIKRFDYFTITFLNVNSSLFHNLHSEMNCRISWNKVVLPCEI